MKPHFNGEWQRRRASRPSVKGMLKIDDLDSEASMSLGRGRAAAALRESGPCGAQRTTTVVLRLSCGDRY